VRLLPYSLRGACKSEVARLIILSEAYLPGLDLARLRLVALHENSDAADLWLAEAGGTIATVK
jgi:hypothetical protein